MCIKIPYDYPELRPGWGETSQQERETFTRKTFVNHCELFTLHFSTSPISTHHTLTAFNCCPKSIFTHLQSSSLVNMCRNFYSFIHLVLCLSCVLLFPWLTVDFCFIFTSTFHTFHIVLSLCLISCAVLCSRCNKYLSYHDLWFHLGILVHV